MLCHYVKRLLSIPSRGQVLVVSTLEPDLCARLQEAGLTAKKNCYANCTRAVMDVVRGAKYALCFVERDGSRRQGHAILQIAGRYYDPTLGPQSLVSGTKYTFWEAFNRRRLLAFIREHHRGAPRNAGGEVEVTPPVLHQDGTVRCEEPQTSQETHRK